MLALELHNDKPMSPMVNAGAMTATSLASATDADDRWRQILQIQSDFAGRSISVSEQISASERATNFHNRAIAWLLFCGGYMYCDPMEACDVYTQQCSTLVTAVDLAIMGATLANGGINPVTAKRVIAQANVSHVLLAEMTMEGLYTSSGDWAYTVGLPAKSGVGGGLVAVSPGNWRSPPIHRRWTRPATACAPRPRSLRSRTPSGSGFSIRSAGTDPCRTRPQAFSCPPPSASRSIPLWRRAFVDTFADGLIVAVFDLIWALQVGVLGGIPMRKKANGIVRVTCKAADGRVLVGGGHSD